jgi:nitroreductase
MRYNLSEITELIRNRRTIYPEQFSERKVHREQIELMLNNAQWAPTHGNTQPWRFIVFADAGREKLSDFLSGTYLEITPIEKQNDSRLLLLLFV